ncbi:transposase [Micromonospora sp. NPDC047707]|uniref:transposase n=1 Tax=Micromonospora sp. NPDC047707 TaxID=3154498 RepID=UPI00345629FE
MWVGDGGEGAKFWLQVLTELKNRGVADTCTVVCDGLKGLPDTIGKVWPEAVVQTCVIHLLRSSFRYAGRQHWDAIAKALRPVYTAPTEAAARARFTDGRLHSANASIVALMSARLLPRIVPFQSQTTSPIGDGTLAHDFPARNLGW